jgi:uncharacterized protein YbjT (DUF2867 family)
MGNKTYAIMGASGNIGKILAETLLKKGHRVHAIGRDKNKLHDLKAQGAEIFTSLFDDSSALAKGFSKCDAVFSLIPPVYQEKNCEAYQDKVGGAIKEALIKTGVPSVLNLSSIGAHLQEGTGPVKGLHRHEERLNTIPKLNVLHLRSGYFMENFNWSIPFIKDFGILGSALRPDLPLPMVATYDIGLKAAELLQTLNFSGQTVFDFMGPKDVTMEEAAKAIGKAIGKPDLKYRQLSYQEVEKGMLEAGMELNTAKLLVEMYQSFNAGKFTWTQEITPKHRGKTTIEEFASTSLAPQILSKTP